MSTHVFICRKQTKKETQPQKTPNFKEEKEPHGSPHVRCCDRVQNNDCLSEWANFKYSDPAASSDYYYCSASRVLIKLLY